MPKPLLASACPKCRKHKCYCCRRCSCCGCTVVDRRAHMYKQGEGGSYVDYCKKKIPFKNSNPISISLCCRIETDLKTNPTATMHPPVFKSYCCFVTVCAEGEGCFCCCFPASYETGAPSSCWRVDFHQKEPLQGFPQKRLSEYDFFVTFFFLRFFLFRRWLCWLCE